MDEQLNERKTKLMNIEVNRKANVQCIKFKRSEMMIE